MRLIPEALKAYLSYKPVEPNTPIGYYEVDGRRYTKLTEESMQNARDTKTIQLQRDCYKRRVDAATVVFGLAALAYKASVVGGVVLDQLAGTGFSLDAVFPDNLTIAFAVGLPVVHRISKALISKWAKNKIDLIGQEMRSRIRKAEETQSPQKYQSVRASNFLGSSSKFATNQPGKNLHTTSFGKKVD